MNDAPINPAQPHALMSNRQAAAWLGVSIRTLDGLVRDGLLPSIKIGARRLFALADLQALVENLKRTASPGIGGVA